MHVVKNSSDLGAKCIVGTVYDEKMQEDEVKVTLIATGFDSMENKKDNRLKEELTLPKEKNIDETPDKDSENKISKWLKKWF